MIMKPFLFSDHTCIYLFIQKLITISTYTIIGTPMLTFSDTYWTTYLSVHVSTLVPLSAKLAHAFKLPQTHVTGFLRELLQNIQRFVREHVFSFLWLFFGWWTWVTILWRQLQILVCHISISTRIYLFSSYVYKAKKI